MDLGLDVVERIRQPRGLLGSVGARGGGAEACGAVPQDGPSGDVRGVRDGAVDELVDLDVERVAGEHDAAEPRRELVSEVALTPVEPATARTTTASVHSPCRIGRSLPTARAASGSMSIR